MVVDSGGVLELHPIELIGSLVVTLGAALFGGLVAWRLRQPVVLGYLVAGAIVGPNALGLVPDADIVASLAEIGVALLMFTLGVQVSLAELGRTRRLAIVGGSIQIVGTAALGYLLGMAFGFGQLPSLFLGAAVALSSTAVALKVLDERGELDSLHGRIVTGVLVVQDLSVVPMIVVLPALAAPDGLAGSLAIALAKATAILVIAYFLGTRTVPGALYRVASLRSPELFLLVVVLLALGTAIGVALAGLSLALGAFIAGLLVSESEYSSEALGSVIPLRDIFAALFFVSVGMLADPGFLVTHPGIVATLVIVVVVGKALFGYGVTVAGGYAPLAALGVGLGLAQIGEFSFVLVQVGVDRGILSRDLFTLTASVATLTILLAPFALGLRQQVGDRVATSPLLRRLFREPVGDDPDTAHAILIGHAVICGYGAAGRALSDVLRARGFPFFVVDYDPNVVADLRRAGVPCVYGDAANPRVLARAQLARARVLALFLPDDISAERTTRHAREINPRLDVIVRAPRRSAIAPLRRAGASELVEPDVEAGLEVVRHSLHRFGVSSQEIAYIVNRLRERWVGEVAARVERGSSGGAQSVE